MAEIYEAGLAGKPTNNMPLFLRREALGKEFHPLAYQLFPAMNEREFGELVESLKINGFYAAEPVTLHEGKILDGRNRALACEVAGVAPTYTDLQDGIDPLQFVIAKNLARRHLGESQRAMIAAKLATMNVGHQSANASIEAISQPQAAELLNVSRASVQRAAEVRDHGVPELQQAVEQGEVSVNAAATIADLPKDEQRSAVRGGKKRVVEVGKKATAAKRVNNANKTTKPKPTSAEPMKLAGDNALLRRIFPPNSSRPSRKARPPPSWPATGRKPASSIGRSGRWRRFWMGWSLPHALSCWCTPSRVLSMTSAPNFGADCRSGCSRSTDRRCISHEQEHVCIQSDPAHCW